MSLYTVLNNSVFESQCRRVHVLVKNKIKMNHENGPLVASEILVPLHISKQLNFH